MALLHTNFFSRVLGIQSSMEVILPEPDLDENFQTGQADGNIRPLPVLYLLHGLSDDQTMWQRQTSIERYVSGRRLAVVMPAVNRSFYTDQVQGYRYWTFVSEELPGIVRGLFRISDKREETFAAGLSMGGYGAVKLGLRCPHKFSAVAGLSGAVDMEARMRSKADLPEQEAEMKRIYGSLERFAGSDDDLFALAAKTAASGKEKPHVFLACGTDDFLYADNLHFLEHLRQLDYNPGWEATPGAGHEWSYWDEMIKKVIDWLPLD